MMGAPLFPTDHAETLPARRSAHARSRFSLGRLVWLTTRLVFLLLAPFLLLVRGATFAHQHYGLGPWLSLATGAAMSALLLMGYVAWAARRLTGTYVLPRRVRRGVLLAVLCYLVYGALYVSASNVKSRDLRSEYHDLNPLLRLGVATLVLFDRDIVLTDLSRAAGDYSAMGLPQARGSSHYEQRDGYARAVDLRTAGRPGWRNAIVTGYFEAMGFQTLRHRGTAVHLHVSLRSPQ